MSEFQECQLHIRVSRGDCSTYWGLWWRLYLLITSKGPAVRPSLLLLKLVSRVLKVLEGDMSGYTYYGNMQWMGGVKNSMAKIDLL